MKTKNTQLIKDSEQLRLVAYLPTPNDRWTIGYGHTKDVFRGMSITEQQAEALLLEDLQWAENTVNRVVKVPLNQNQFDALVSLCFNIGSTAFSNSTLVRVLNKGDYVEAANQILRWDKQAGRTLRGLTIRRTKERELFLLPISNSPSEALGGSLVASGGVLATLVATGATWPVVALVGALAALLIFIIHKKVKNA